MRTLNCFCQTEINVTTKMIGTTSEVNSQVTDLVFVVEGTANMGAYLGELRANYILPTLEYFNGGTASEDKDYGSELNSTMCALVVFMAADIAPESAVTCFGSPTTCISKFLGWLDKIPFLGGAAEGSSHIAEGLGAALQAFDDFQTLRDPHITTQKHCILICNSPPYPLPCLESVNYAGMLCEQLATLMCERNINLSIISPRKIPALLKLFDMSSGDLQLSQSKNYTKDRRHLVLLKGYQLQERPLSPTSVDIKDKLPVSNPSLPMEKSMIANSNLMSVGSPSSNPSFKGGKRKAVSPPNPAPFKQMATQGIGNMGPIGIGIHNQQQQQANQQQTAPMTTSTPNSIISGNMSNIQMNVQQQMPVVNSVRPMGTTGMPINRLPPPQSSQSFMNQPNPPNVTITNKGPLLPVNSTPVETSMGRPIRDQTPVTGPQGQRMLWNPPGRAPMPGGPPGNTGMQNVNLPNSGMSPLVARLNQPARANSGIMAGQRPPGPDMVISMTRAPNVTGVNANAMNNNPGQGNLVGMLQQGNMVPTGTNILNQTPGMQSNMMHATNKDMNQQLNMGPPGGMMNAASNMPNQIGGQASQNFVLLQQQSGVNQMQQLSNNQAMMSTQQSQVQQAAHGMQASNQLQGQSNMTGGVVQSTMSGPMNQMTGMGTVPGQSTMGQTPNTTMQGQVGNPQTQMQQPQQKEKRVIWQGIIEWQEKPKIPNDPSGKVNRHVHCQVASAVNALGECEVNADKWPKKLIMQLIPKVLMHQFGNAFLKASRNVVFHFSKSAETADALASLNKVMTSGFVGCVHFSGQQNINCDIRILMLVYSNDMYTYVGFIPNDQVGFVATIRNVITKKQQQTAKQQQPGSVMPPQAQQQLFGVQGGQANQQMNPGMGAGMNLPMTGPAGGLSGPGNVSVLPVSLNNSTVSSGATNMLPSTVTGPARGVTLGPNISNVQGRNSPNLQMQPQGMMGSHPVTGNMNPAANTVNNAAAGSIPTAGKPQVAGMGNNQNQGAIDLERQQNLLKIEQLRQSLIAAQQKEVQYKAAQEQHQQHHHVPNGMRQNDVLLLQQLQQQHQQQQQQQPRMMANSAPTNSNPQLRQLLQINQQMMLSLQGNGQRQGVPEMGQGLGSGQPSLNTGSNIFPDDII
ncbi:Mediator of RNA polymerase II transcription subunit 25 [Chamberlinius hualienensis]